MARVSITLPPDVLATADDHAAAAHQPRSWAIAEAIRSYRGRAAPEPHDAADVAAARREHLLSDLRLSPEERLRRAESLLRLVARRRGPPRVQVVGFASYEDFYAWKKARRAEGLPRP